jgi:hypothetical protein
MKLHVCWRVCSGRNGVGLELRKSETARTGTYRLRRELVNDGAVVYRSGEIRARGSG